MPRSHLSASAAIAAVLAFFFVAGPDTASAQVNIETLASDAELGFGGTVGGSFALRRGNVRYDELGAHGGVHWANKHKKAPEGDVGMPWFRFRVLASGNLKRRTALEERIANEGFYHLRFTDMVHPRIGYEVFHQEQFNEFRRLKLRSLVGGGARTVLLNIPEVQLWAGTGYMAEWEAWDAEDAAITDEQQLNHRWTSYVGIRLALVDDIVSFVSTTYFQPRLDDFEDIQLLEEADLVVKIGKHFAFVTSLDLQWDTRPIPDVEGLDITLSNGIKISF